MTGGEGCWEGGGEWGEEEAEAHQRGSTLERPLYLTFWNTITPVCMLSVPARFQAVSSTSWCVFVYVCVLWFCVSFLLQIKYHSKASPPCHTYLLPPGSTSILVLCDTFLPLSCPPLCFLLSCLSLVFFPVCLSPDNSPLSKLSYVNPPAVCSFLCSPSCAPYSHSLSFRAAFFSLTLVCLLHRDREGVWVDSCSSHLCSLIGQRRSRAAGEWANHGVHPSADWQWPEGKWSHPCLEIWPALGYVLTEIQKLTYLFVTSTRIPLKGAAVIYLLLCKWNPLQWVNDLWNYQHRRVNTNLVQPLVTGSQGNEWIYS